MIPWNNQCCKRPLRNTVGGAATTLAIVLGSMLHFCARLLVVQQPLVTRHRTGRARWCDALWRSAFWRSAWGICHSDTLERRAVSAGPCASSWFLGWRTPLNRRDNVAVLPARRLLQRDWTERQFYVARSHTSGTPTWCVPLGAHWRGKVGLACQLLFVPAPAKWEQNQVWYAFNAPKLHVRYDACCEECTRLI